MTETLSVDNFLIAGTQGVIIDVRSPAEFEAGHIAGAHNIPIFSNDERAVVGTIYKQVGHEEAVEKGLEFVGVKMVDMVREAKRLSDGLPLYLYCWRGGMRSASMAWLFSTAGLSVSLLRGGYKAYRAEFDSMLERNPWHLVLLSGATGCGKTEILSHLSNMGEQVLDLEGLANHKGSVFGGFGQQQQPTTEEFINRLHHRMRELDSSRRVWCEGESMLIGHVFIPQNLFAMMQRAEVIEVSMPIEQRLDRLVVEYGSFSIQMLNEAFEKIRKRSGNEQTQCALDALEVGDVREAANIALQYYDKAYSKSSSVKRANSKVCVELDNNDMINSAREILNIVI